MHECITDNCVVVLILPDWQENREEVRVQSAPGSGCGQAHQVSECGESECNVLQLKQCSGD